MKLEERTTPHLPTSGNTYGIQPESCTSGIHRGAGVHHFSGVPNSRSATRLARQRRRGSYEFDGDLLVVQEVGALKDDTKGAFTDLLAHTVVDTHHI
jgi:hypothetical protein